MIRKVLIANRGEIAIRIIRACQQLNIQTVAVYSEADAHAKHVKMADEAYLLGPSSVQESYLNMDKILSIAKKANVDAIHPGYGFLSENAQFVKRCEEQNIIFIGPTKHVLKEMGDKITARRRMKEAGIPIIPGSIEKITNKEKAIKLARKIGFPIMVKASAGGGGIGMEIVDSEEKLLSSIENNSKRAETFFGDGSIYLEKAIERARHIEVQILADNYGKVVHLFDRECSIQRRNQKIIEEAPSPFLSKKTREKLMEAAVEAAKAIRYINAGTIEFLVDEEENFYFLEMNTRIQVEHPVTEEITGIDIVKKQIEIAANKPLKIHQQDIQKEGHAIEVRIYAEDPKTFFPSPGKIRSLHIPQKEYARHEISVESGDEVTHFYDPMIGKLIVHGKNRQEVIIRLQKCLNEYDIQGIQTNLPLLRDIVSNEAFKRGQTTTDFIKKHYLS